MVTTVFRTDQAPHDRMVVTTAPDDQRLQPRLDHGSSPRQAADTRRGA